MRESAAMGETLLRWEPTAINPTVATTPTKNPPTRPTGNKDQGTVDDVPKPSGISWMLVVLLSFSFVGCLCMVRRRQRQRARREHYSIASRYDDSSIDMNELELT
jgi:hypothetical protein